MHPAAPIKDTKGQSTMTTIDPFAIGAGDDTDFITSSFYPSNVDDSLDRGDEQDSEDPTGPRGQQRENNGDVYRHPLRFSKKRWRGGNSEPRASIPNQTPGSQRIQP
jgi:hypothetical protein